MMKRKFAMMTGAFCAALLAGTTLSPALLNSQNALQATAASPEISIDEDDFETIDAAGDVSADDMIPDVEIISEPGVNSSPDHTVDDEASSNGGYADRIEIEHSTEIEAEPDPHLEHTRVSVHDPSIIQADDGRYYILGSHTASAVSDDLIGWKQLNVDYGNPADTPFYGSLQESFEKPFRWAGYNDGDCLGGYAIWAPDIIWNPQYQWEDGTTGAYMLYCCTSSTWRRSCISYLVSRTIDGTYTFGDTIVYSGFTKNGKPDGNSSRDTKWDNDYLNLNELLEKGSENGGINEISDNWFDATGAWNHLYAPNAIDPNLFFDDTGEHLYMSYGSWSGGLFLLELDPATGKARYPGIDSVDEISGNFVDRYFGVHLAGGNHESGEGPYIEYDPETGYYYLYETYGGLTAEGGYNMRLFRSEHPTGPYLDAAGGNAADNGRTNDRYGIKLIGNYSFYGQMGKRAAGHNSALIDGDGNHYLIYHQRFDIKPQLEGHEVRVHQQFLNEDLWPVTAVYEYSGEQPEHYEDTGVIGSYEFINHGTKTDGDMLPTDLLTLNEDGTVSGAAEGTWTKSDSGRGFDYVTFEMNGVTYKGYFFRQLKENREETPVMTFSALGDDNTCIWGSMVDMENEDMLVNMAAAALEHAIPAESDGNLSLPTGIMGASVAWETSDASVITADGIAAVPSEDSARARLTATITSGGASTEAVFKILIRSSSKEDRTAGVVIKTKMER